MHNETLCWGDGGDGRVNNLTIRGRVFKQLSHYSQCYRQKTLFFLFFFTIIIIIIIIIDIATIPAVSFTGCSFSKSDILKNQQVALKQYSSFVFFPSTCLKKRVF